MQCAAVCYSVFQRDVAWCSVLKCVAACCSVWQRVAVLIPHLGLSLPTYVFQLDQGSLEEPIRGDGRSEPTSRTLVPHKESLVGCEMTKCSKCRYSNSNRRFLLGLAVIHEYQGGGAILLGSARRISKSIHHTDLNKFEQ